MDIIHEYHTFVPYSLLFESRVGRIPATMLTFLVVLLDDMLGALGNKPFLVKICMRSCFESKLKVVMSQEPFEHFLLDFCPLSTPTFLLARFHVQCKFC